MKCFSVLNSFCAMLVAGTLFARAADTAATPDSGAAGVGNTSQTTAATDPLRRLMHSFAELQKGRAANARECAGLREAFSLLKRSENDAALLKEALRLRWRCSHYLKKLELERAKHIGFKADMDSYAAAAGPGLLAQEQSYLSHYLDEVRAWGQRQNEEEKAAKGLIGRTERLAEALPPPPGYVNEIGMAMRLVPVRGRGRKTFYLSGAPVTVAQWNRLAKHSDSIQPVPPAADEAEPRTTVSLAEARDFATAASRYMLFRYSLLDGAQAEAAEKCRRDNPEFLSVIPVASWMGVNWLSDKYTANADEAEAAARFGMTMGAVWDPAGLLFRRSGEEDSTVCGELPQAAYQRLGFYLAAPAGAGSAARYNAVAAEVEEEENGRVAAAGSEDEGRGDRSEP